MDPNNPSSTRPYHIELIRSEIRGTPPPKKPRTPPPEPYHPPREPGFLFQRADRLLKNAHKLPPSQMLFDGFWCENELCIMFADTNVGKSILAVQIGQSICSGTPIPGMQLTAKPAPVLYMDLELTDLQFQQRYYTSPKESFGPPEESFGPGHGAYAFHKGFTRGTHNPLANKQRLFASYRDYFENEMENTILFAKAKVLIVDNINCLGYDSFSAPGALALVRSLQAIKTRQRISILALAHTPKRNPERPLDRNDLQGSKMLLNFCDSAFAIGESHTKPGMRYLKQIKQRSAQQQYGAENVCLGHIVKDNNFLQFKFTGHAPETSHLAFYTERYRKNLETRVARLKQQNVSVRNIASELSVASSTVFRILKRLERKELDEGEEKEEC